MTVVREIESARLKYTYTHTCTSLWSDMGAPTAITRLRFMLLKFGGRNLRPVLAVGKTPFPVRAQRHYALSQPGQVALAPIPNVGRWPWIP